MRRWMLVVILIALGAGCGSKLPEGEACSSDDECETGYCECASACRDGCCAAKPDLLYDACTTDCLDLACPSGE